MFVPFFGMECTTELVRMGVTPLMRCETVYELHEARQLLERAGVALRAIFDKHGPGCSCPFCVECPHVWTVLDVTVDSVFDHLHLLDQFAPVTARGMEEILEDARNGAFGEEAQEAANAAAAAPHIVATRSCH